MPAISAPRIGDRPTSAGRQAGEDHGQQADRQEQLGVLGARGLREQRRQARSGRRPACRDDEQPEERGAHELAGFGVAADQLDQEQHRDQRQVLEQQHREGGLADRRLRCPRSAGPARSRTERARVRAPPPRGAVDRSTQQPAADQHRAADQLGAADAEHRPAHAPQSAEADVQPGREQQQDDAELGERLDARARR